MLRNVKLGPWVMMSTMQGLAMPPLQCCLLDSTECSMIEAFNHKQNASNQTLAGTAEAVSSWPADLQAQGMQTAHKNLPL